jgi:hypothetical protein
VIHVCYRGLRGLHTWIVEGPCQSESGAFYSRVNAQETPATAAVRALRLGVCSPHRVMGSLQDIVVGSEGCKAVICEPTTSKVDQNTWATLVATQALHVACGGQLPWQVLV